MLKELAISQMKRREDDLKIDPEPICLLDFLIQARERGQIEMNDDDAVMHVTKLLPIYISLKSSHR